MPFHFPDLSPRIPSFCLLLAITAVTGPVRADEPSVPFRLAWKDNMLTVTGGGLPGKTLTIWYLEAYCRPGSTDRDWHETTIGHTTELVSQAKDGTELILRCTLKDGVIVNHRIRAVADGVAFDLIAQNPTDRHSLADWAQPCIRVDRFTGADQTGYLKKSFVFIDGEQTFFPTKPWAKQARYVPGQVWVPKAVPRTDVNPRPLSPLVPSNGLIGCVSADEKWLLATAWEPYQELFQGVIVCLHSDFRIGGLKPGERKPIHGRLYLMPNDTEQLLAAYRRDFPNQSKSRP